MPIIPVDQKFHTLNASTPTKDRGSAQTDSLREIYTMQDIIDSVGGGGGAAGTVDATDIGGVTPRTYSVGSNMDLALNDPTNGLVATKGWNVTGINIV